MRRICACGKWLCGLQCHGTLLCQNETSKLKKTAHGGDCKPWGALPLLDLVARGAVGLELQSRKACDVAAGAGEFSGIHVPIVERDGSVYLIVPSIVLGSR